MKLREVEDGEGVRWTCVQALSGVRGEAAERAAARIEGDEGTVTVVCTPSGGARSVRLALERGWEESVTDEALLSAIASASSSPPGDPAG